jgi:integrase/recombinase XerD
LETIYSTFNIKVDRFGFRPGGAAELSSSGPGAQHGMAAFHLTQEPPMTTSLRQRMTEDMQLRNLSPLTQSSYVQQVSMFARHFDKSPAVLGLEDIRDYQLYLTNQKKLDASSIKVAVSAIRFLYRVTLKRPWDFVEAVPSPKKPRTLPIILSPEEVLQFLGCVTNIKQRTILTTCYTAGLRISEAVHLMPSAIDRQRMVIRIEQGKGRKDRYVMLSPKLLQVLSDYWHAARPRGCLFPGDRPATRCGFPGPASQVERERSVEDAESQRRCGDSVTL